MAAVGPKASILPTSHTHTSRERQDNNAMTHSGLFSKHLTVWISPPKLPCAPKPLNATVGSATCRLPSCSSHKSAVAGTRGGADGRARLLMCATGGCAAAPTTCAQSVAAAALKSRELLLLLLPLRVVLVLVLAAAVADECIIAAPSGPGRGRAVAPKARRSTTTVRCM